MEWNEIEGLTVQEQNWLDELAHGYVTRENFTWVVQLLCEQIKGNHDKEK